MEPSATPSAARRQPPTWLEAAGIVAGLALVVGLMLLAFGLPAVNGGPHDVPLGVVAPPAGVAAVEDALAKAAPGGFEVQRYTDEQDLRNAIADRDVYGGFVFGQPGVRVLTASAASPAVAQGISTIGIALAGHSGATATTVDVRPLPADDPRGAGLAAVGLPLVLGGVLPALVLTRSNLRWSSPRRPWVRVGAALAFAVVEGPLVASVLTWWFGSVDANFVPVALGLSFGMAAVALTVLGLESLLGIAGFGLGAATFVLLGNPLSGLASGPEFLPSGWGTFGQLLPPGASATLLRGNAYFDGAGTTGALMVLTCWVAAALLLVALSTIFTRGAAPSVSSGAAVGGRSGEADAVAGDGSTGRVPTAGVGG